MNILQKRFKIMKEKEYDCIMFWSDITKTKWKKEFLSKIDKNDIYDPNNDGDYGLEDEPHITLLYGIHPDEVDKDLAINLIKTISPIELESKKISIFENEEFDVVKIEIIPNNTLLQLRKILINILPNTQTFKDYNPHMTISYVKKGKGKKYIEKFKEPIKFNFNKIVYSDSNHEKEFFKLNESMAGVGTDIKNAIKLNSKNLKKSKKSNNDLKNYLKNEFKNMKKFNEFIKNIKK